MPSAARAELVSGNYFSVMDVSAVLGRVFELTDNLLNARAHEIGIRVALGAQHGDVLWQIVRERARLRLIGVAIGLAGSFALGRLLAGLLYGVLFLRP